MLRKLKDYGGGREKRIRLFLNGKEVAAIEARDVERLTSDGSGWWCFGFAGDYVTPAMIELACSILEIEASWFEFA